MTTNEEMFLLYWNGRKEMSDPEINLKIDIATSDQTTI